MFLEKDALIFFVGWGQQQQKDERRKNKQKKKFFNVFKALSCSAVVNVSVCSKHCLVLTQSVRLFMKLYLENISVMSTLMK